MAVSVVEVAIDISEQCAIRDTVRKALTFFLNKALCSLYELERQENLQEKRLFQMLCDLEYALNDDLTGAAPSRDPAVRSGHRSRSPRRRGARHPSPRDLLSRELSDKACDRSPRRRSAKRAPPDDLLSGELSDKACDRARLGEESGSSD